MTHVKCTCGTLFGIEQPDGSLEIKYRDLRRRVTGSVTGPCRKCGNDVTWPTVPYTIPQWTPTSPVPFSYSCNCACSLCVSGMCCWLNGRTFQSNTTYTWNHTRIVDE